MLTAGLGIPISSLYDTTLSIESWLKWMKYITLRAPRLLLNISPTPSKPLKRGIIKSFLNFSFLGTYNMLGLAKRCGARFLLASTSGTSVECLTTEIYGDPNEHPQTESYWGNVNPIGPRSCYDEGKRIAETLTYEYLRQGHVATRVARIFNTYGPRQSIHDGRVVSNFITQAIRGRHLEIYGDGSQTRSFCFVDDLIGGLVKLMESDCTEPVNLGNPEEFTVLEFADMVLEIVGRKDGETSTIQLKEGMIDDPKRRRPDISRAKEVLGWQPKWNVRKGIQETVEYFRALEKVAPEET
jgi:UDP-glucuronate decarboxylase